MSSEQGEAELLKLVTNETNGAGLALRIDMNGSYLMLGEVVVLHLLPLEVCELTHEVRDSGVDLAGTSINNRGSAFMNESSGVNLECKSGFDKGGTVGKVHFKGLGILEYY